MVRHLSAAPLLRQRPTAPLHLPRRMRDAGWTRVLALPVATNAGQRAVVTVTGGRGLRVSRQHHALRVWLPGTRATRVVVRVRAPATAAYLAMSISRTYRGHGVR